MNYTRLLKKHNVAVLFEKESINTLAQQESERISTHVKMGLKMKIKLKNLRKYFDADVFESIVEKIILGGIDDKGQKELHS